MTGVSNSFLERRRTELLTNEHTVPASHHELKEQAQECLPKGPYDYLAGGAGSEGTMQENRAMFRRYQIVSRVLRDVSDRSLETSLFGHDSAAPIALAPIGGQKTYHEEGELATARATRELGVPMTVSNLCSHSIEDIAAANGDGLRFFQLYWPNDWDIAANLIRRAEAAGYDAIFLTVDSKISKWRPRNLQNAYAGISNCPNIIYESDPVVQSRAEAAGQSVREFVRENPAVDDDPSITWDDLDRLRTWTDLPIVLKGILSQDDAKRACEWGAEGIVVSNHGGRQIDGEVGALDQLPGIVDTIGDRMTVLLDSGVRSGSDVFKALALGADAVLFGRPYIFGLAIAGQDGVRESVLNCLAEVESIMGLSGYPEIGDIDRRAIVERETIPADSDDNRQ